MNTLQKLEKHRKLFPPGSLLMEQGDDSHEVVLLAHGQAEVLIDGEVVAEIDCSEHEQFVGEMSPLMHEPRCATVRAKTLCTAYCFPGDALEQIIGRAPSLGIKLARSLAEKLHHTTEELIHLRYRHPSRRR